MLHTPVTDVTLLLQKGEKKKKKKEKKTINKLNSRGKQESEVVYFCSSKLIHDDALNRLEHFQN
jgi:hypothetical protein